MKTRRLSFLLCLVLLLGILSPAALAVSPEVTPPGDDPVDPDPYNYINYIIISLDISNTGRSSNYCRAYVSDTSCTCTIDAELQRKLPGASWDTATTVKTWSSSGVENVKVDEDWYVYYGYVYRLVATVEVYNSNGYLGDSTTVYSNIVAYP